MPHVDEPVDEPRTEADDRARIQAAIGKRPASLVPAPGHGAPSHRRWLVAFDDGSTAFAKIAAYDYTAEWLRLERTNYEVLTGHDYLPRVLGWHDDGEAPALVLEDLAGADWPPPWTTARIDAVLEALSAVQATPPPEQIHTLFGEMFDIREGWLPLRADPGRALALGVFDETWLAAWGETLTRAADEAALGGGALLHGDVRSDNLCLIGERAVLGLELGLCRIAAARRGGVVAEPAPRGRAGTLGDPAGPGTGRLALGGLLLGARWGRAHPAGAARPAVAAGSGPRRAGVGVPRTGDRGPGVAARRHLHLQHAATLAAHGHRSRRLR